MSVESEGTPTVSRRVIACNNCPINERTTASINENQFEVVSTRSLSAEENLWIDIRLEMIKQSPKRVIESLIRLLTLSTVLSGVVFIALKDEVVIPWARVIAASFFFASVLASACGLIPIDIVTSNSPDVIRESIGKAVRWKKKFVYISFASIALGLLFAIVGFFQRGIVL